MKKSNNRQFERIQGNRTAVAKVERSILFSWKYLDESQGQTHLEWENESLLSKFIKYIRVIEGYAFREALAKKLIKIYPFTDIPRNSEFNKPISLKDKEFKWAVIHIENNSKEVVVGFFSDEDCTFYIVFLDRHHKFYPTDIQERGKKKDKS